MSIFKKLGQLGFTLMEVVITTAVLSALALAIVNQMQLANFSKRSSSETAIINGITDRLAVELSNQDVCTANFKNKTINILRTFAPNETIFAADGVTELIKKGGYYGKKSASGSSLSASDASTVYVLDITTQPNASDTNEMNLEITFQKKTGGTSFLRERQKVNLPITVIRTAAGAGPNIDYCFNDITNSIQSAIRLSCKGNTDYYDPTINPPYGACYHNIVARDCAASGNQFISKMEWDPAIGQNTVKVGCTGLQTTCPIPNQVITGFNASGIPTCDWPLPNCLSGQMMIKSAAGPYICLNTNSGCSGFQAIKSFNSDGTVSCAQFYPPNSCAGMVTSIQPGSMTCSTYVKPKTCGVGEFVSSFDASGNAICSRFIVYPQNCPGGQGATGVDINGNLTCQPLLRRTSCNGVSSTTNTYNTCTGAGGTVQNAGTTNAFCKFNTATCPGGWGQCPTWAARNSATCTDTNSACSYSTMVTRTAAAMVFNTPVTAQTVTCDYWARNSGPWVYSCTKYVGSGPSATTPMTQIGCY
jgi:prepilin-type N-terminal cleavage/methylation domain-containing protein